MAKKTGALIVFFFTFFVQAEPIALTKNEIFELQERLSANGYSVNFHDGILGRKTKIAIGDYAKKNSLEPLAEVVLAHIRGSYFQKKSEENALKDRIKNLEKQLEILEQLVNLNKENSVFLSATSIKNLVDKAKEEAKSDIQTILIGLLASVVLTLLGYLALNYFVMKRLYNEAKEMTKKELDDEVRTSLDSRLSEINADLKSMQEALEENYNKTTAKSKSEISEAKNQHNRDFSSITGRISFLLFDLNKLIENKKLSIEGLDLETLEALFRHCLVASMNASLKLGKKILHSKSLESLYALTNGIYHFADMIKNGKLSASDESEARSLIKEAIELVSEEVVYERNQSLEWANMVDNICYGMAVTNHDDAELKKMLLRLKAYVDLDRSRPIPKVHMDFSGDKGYLSIYPSDVRSWF